MDTIQANSPHFESTSIGMWEIGLISELLLEWVRYMMYLNV